MYSLDEVKSFPTGRVIHRWITPNGSHQKMRIVNPLSLNICEICKMDIKGNAVKTEAGGNHTILTQCLPCAVDELQEIELNKKRLLH